MFLPHDVSISRNVLPGKKIAHIPLMQISSEAALEDHLHNYGKVVLFASARRLSVH
jgi:hypothetical protein